MLKAFQNLLAAARYRNDRRLVLASGLFDAEWYRLAYPYVVRDRIDPLQHFLQHGRKHRLAPSRAFDTARYLDQHADAKNSNLNPLVHYLKQGRANGLKIHAAPPSDADRILASGLFDAAWYLDRYPDAAKDAPLLHYLVHGVAEGHSPGPGFDAEWYLARYPDVFGLHPLLHFIDHGRQEGRAPMQPTRALEIARQTLAGVEDLDPELSSADYFDDAGRLDVIDGRTDSRVARCFERIIKTLANPPRTLVFLPWLIDGETGFAAGHAVRAMGEAHGPTSVLIVLTDHDREEAPHLLPADVQLISLLRIEPALSLPERAELVDLLIRSLQPEAVLNVNSVACWEAVKRGGRKLRHFARLFAMLPEQADLRYCLPFLTGVYFNNATRMSEIVQQLGIPESLQSRLVVLRQPAPPMAKIAPRPREEGEPLRVLWADRIMPQNNVDLLIRIAEAAPEIEFHIWGRGSHALEGLLADLAACCRHVHFHGAFERFDMLPIAEYDAFLHTSRGDGIPNVLLEAAAVGLPIVTSHGGELIDQRTGWPVAGTSDPTPYVKALGEIGNSAEKTARRVAAMRARLRKDHDWERYRNILALEPHLTGGLLNGAGIDHGGAERPSRGDAGKAVAGQFQARDGTRRKSRASS
jgi:glycosyltransferase involved in cell wall biosynthesis